MERKFTPEEVIEEARRAVNENTINGKFEIPEKDLSPMIGILPAHSEEIDLFMTTFRNQIVQNYREWKEKNNEV